MIRDYGRTNKKLLDEKEKVKERETSKVPVRATRQVMNYAKKHEPEEQQS